MAITISQEPTSPNMANNNLLYTLDSTKKTEPQFQYVCDIYASGSTYSATSANYLQRVKQQPNPDGYGIFDIGQLIIQYLGDDQPWKAAPFNTSSFTQGDFVVRFGEQYGVSFSSSISTYNGIDTTPSQNPAKTGSAFYSYTNGLVDPYNAVNWNFASSSYYSGSTTPTGGSGNFTRSSTLSNASTTQSIADGDYETISLYNGNFDLSSTNAQDVYYVQVRVYNAAGSNIQNIGFFNTTANDGGPRTSEAQEWSAVYTSQSDATRLLHIGVGPQNLADSGNTLNTAWSYYIVDVMSQEGAGIEDSTALWSSTRFNKAEGDCVYNGVRFAWKNEYGTYDYYTFTLQSDSATSIERNSYKKTFVDFSNGTTSVPYNKQRRGQTQYYNALNNVKTANSNWLTDDEATWLKELFFSPNVYIQNGTDFEPVVITTADVVEKTNPRTQKNFQYLISFQPANQPRPRQ